VTISSLIYEHAVKGWKTQEVPEMLPAVGEALDLVYQLQMELQVTQKKRELLKNLTKIEEIQQKFY